MIRLQSITADNYKACLELQVSEHQQTFVSSNAVSLASAYVFRDIAAPLAIYRDDLMIGFVLLRQIEEWIGKEKRSKEIVVSCKHDNQTARKLYTRSGYEFLSEDGDEVNFIKRI